MQLGGVSMELLLIGSQCYSEHDLININAHRNGENLTSVKLNLEIDIKLRSRARIRFFIWRSQAEEKSSNRWASH